MSGSKTGSAAGGGANGHAASGGSSSGHAGTVVVVGGGLAGVLAAIAAREAGARVRLVKRAWGSTALSYGCIDVAPSPPARRGASGASRGNDGASGASRGNDGASGASRGNDGASGPDRAPDTHAQGVAALLGALRAETPKPRSIAECLLALAQRPEHPYARVGDGIDALGTALSRLRTGCPELELTEFDPTAPNLLLPTDCGTVREAAVCLGSLRAGDLRSLRGARRVGLAEFIALPGLPATMTAELLAETATAAGLATLPTFVPVRIGYFRRHADAFASTHSAAALLDDDDAFERFSRAVAEAVAPLGLDVLLLPPILGTARAAARTRRLSELTGCAVAETVAGVDAVPGRRLQGALDAWAPREGVNLLAAHAVGVEAEAGGRVRALTLQPWAPSGLSQTSTMPVRVDGDAFVLASGRFIGGGVAAQGGLARETLFGLPLWEGGAPVERLDPLRQTRRDPAERQQLFRAGLATDARLRPLEATGAVAHANLFAAGSVLGGHDPAADQCGLGVAAVTGWLAGVAAAQLAAEHRPHAVSTTAFSAAGPSPSATAS